MRINNRVYWHEIYVKKKDVMKLGPLNRRCILSVSFRPTEINTGQIAIIGFGFRLVLWRIKKIEERGYRAWSSSPTSTKHASYLHLCTDPIFNASLLCSLRLWRENIHSSIEWIIILIWAYWAVLARCMNGTLFILIISTKKLFAWRDSFPRAHKYYSTAWELSMQ